MGEHEQWVEILKAGGAAPSPLDPQRTALVVVDMQRYFTEPSFPLTDAIEKLSPGLSTGYLNRVRETVIPGIQRLLACFRELGGPVFFTAVGSETGDGADLPPWLRTFDALGVETLGVRVFPPVDDPSWQIDLALAPRPGEPVLNKLSAGTFATTDLERQLRGRGVEYVVVTGVCTDVCVSTTAREAADRKFKAVVVSDACTTLSEQLHNANLETLHVFGAVRTTSEVLDAMRAASTAVQPAARYKEQA